MRNPFYYGNEVSGDDFCDREQELRELADDVRSGLNVLLYAPRRIGKTSLLRRLQRDLAEHGQYSIVFFDFFSVSSVDEFIQGYFNAVAKSFDTGPERMMNLLKSVLKVRPNIQVTVGQSGELMYGMSFSRKERAASLEDVLNLPHVFSQAKKRRIVVIFDEFQEIEQFDLEKKFRSIVQTHGRNVSYLFSGSKKSILQRMFHDRSRAFYRSVKHLSIGEIPLDRWTDFIQTKFTRTSKEISQDLIRQAFAITRGFPYYMQQLMFEIWSRTETLADDQIVLNAVQLMCEREYSLYSLVWSDLTPNQKKTLKYIVQSDGRNLYASEQLGETGLTASTLKSTLDGLMKKDVCDRTDEGYSLVDPMMRQWVERYML